jgi:UPF0716 family protein affecting phage T7 exclusion
MKLSKIAYGVVFASLAMMLPVLLPAQAEKLAQNTIEISRQDSSNHAKSNESQHLDDRDHDSEKDDDHKEKDDHDNDRNEKDHDHNS